MEQWDIYDENKQKTGRTMNRNDWNMQPGDFHLTVLGVLRRPDGTYLITRRRMDKEWAPGCWEVPGGGVRAGESAGNLRRNWRGCFQRRRRLFFLLQASKSGREKQLFC